MNKVIKRTVIISVATLLVGAVFCGLGAAMGGKMAFAVDFKNHKVYTGVGKTTEGKLEFEKFSSIDLKVDTEDVELVRTKNEYGIEYLVQGEEPQITVENGILKVRKASKGFGYFQVGFNFRAGKDCYVRIFVPEEAVFENVKLVTDTGDITLRELETGKLTLESDTGDVRIEQITAAVMNLTTDTGDIVTENMKAEKGRLESDTGDIRIREFDVEAVTLETDTGDIKVESMETESFTADSDTGDIKAVFVGEAENFGIKCKSDVGNVKVDGSSQGKKYTAEGNGKNQINVTTDTGDITISFLDDLQ